MQTLRGTARAPGQPHPPPVESAAATRRSTGTPRRRPAIGRLHEAAGTGPDTEHAAAAALFAAGVLARLRGPVLWALARDDLFAPALAGVGLHPDRLILAKAGRQVLSVMEEGLRHRGLAGVVGEVEGGLTLTASRRLQLAAEASGVTAIVLRRSRRMIRPACIRTTTPPWPSRTPR